MSEPAVSRARLAGDLLVLALGAGVLFGVGLGARDLWNPNEPIYGEAVVEMRQADNPWIPRVNGQVFAEKPILYFWLALAATVPGDEVDEFRLRLPGAIAGVLAVLALYGLVLGYAGRGQALLTAALFATTFGVFWGARTIQMDILVLLFALLAVLAVTRVVDHGAPAARGWALAGIAAGMGFLAKGPVGWICAAVPVLLYLLFSGRARQLTRPAAGIALVAAVVVPAPWLAILALSGETDFLWEMLWRQNFVRFVNAWDHVGPPWYYLVYFWIDMAPWSWLAPLALGLERRERGERQLSRLAWVWIVGTVVFFSLSDSKRSAYILPIAPAVAVLAAIVVRRLAEDRLGVWRKRLALALCGAGGLFLAGTGLILWLRGLERYPELGTAGLAMALLMTMGGAIVVLSLLLSRGRPLVTPTALFSLVLVTYLLAGAAVLPAANRLKSARPFCERTAAVVGLRAPIASYGFWRWRSEYRFYLGRPLVPLRGLEELRRYWLRDGEVFLILERSRLAEARQVLGPIEPLLEARIGSKRALLFSNRRDGLRERADRPSTAGTA